MKFYKMKFAKNIKDCFYNVTFYPKGYLFKDEDGEFFISKDNALNFYLGIFDNSCYLSFYMPNYSTHVITAKDTEDFHEFYRVFINDINGVDLHENV